MSFTDIKTKSQGFTIVELLIVVVVIAILAAITIVSYNGITSRANSSAAAANAATVQKKAELFASDGSTSKYPAVFTDLSTAAASTTYYLGTSITNTGATALSASNGKNAVQYLVCGTGASTTAPSTIATITTVTGGQINYWDFTNSAVKNVTVGQAGGLVGTNNVGCAAS